MPWRDIPPRWWAVLVGVLFGSVALIGIDGPKKGYSKAVIGGLLSAPFLALLAGALLPDGTSLEIAALIGGVVSVGGTGVIVTVGRYAPSLATAALTGVAESYLHINRGEATRLNRDGTPMTPDPEAEQLIEKIDKKDESDEP